MKAGGKLVGGLVFLCMSCHFTDDRKPTVNKSKTKDSAVIENKIIQKQPVTAQTKPYEGQYCFIKKAYTHADTSYIEADYIQFLMGDQAVAAAKKKGEADAVLDDYYVVNDNPAIRKLALAKNVTIQLVVTEDGKSFFTTGNDELLQKKLREGIFVLQFTNGLVTKIQEQFLP